MRHILPEIYSLEQHLYYLEHHPEMYQPEQCPHCGCADVWRHGHYHRKAEREGTGLGLIPIPRFYCHHCQTSCSTLPACIAQLRWYSWQVQQQTLLVMLLSGVSIRKAARTSRPGRHTFRRWWRWLEERFDRYSFHLRSHFPELGRASSQERKGAKCC